MDSMLSRACLAVASSSDVGLRRREGRPCRRSASLRLPSSASPLSSWSSRRRRRKGYRPPRTPWGDPDLQGKWPSNQMAGVPLQRAESLGTRNVLTDEEFAQRQAQAARQSTQDTEDFDFDNPSVPFGQVGGGQSPPQHWFERGEPQRQASLIVDPPNGRMPAMTAAAQKREAQRRAERASRGPSGWTRTFRSTSAASRAASSAPSCRAATTTVTRSCNHLAT